MYKLIIAIIWMLSAILGPVILFIYSLFLPDSRQSKKYKPETRAAAYKRYQKFHKQFWEEYKKKGIK